MTSLSLYLPFIIVVAICLFIAAKLIKKNEELENKITSLYDEVLKREKLTHYIKTAGEIYFTKADLLNECKKLDILK
jgi:CMP-N-acetylneuraminic acid synthetase